MDFDLTEEQLQKQEEYKKFVDEEVVPTAKEFDLQSKVEMDLIKKMAGKGYLGAIVPKKYGGLDLDMITLGLLHEEFGRGYTSVQNILTVYGMALMGICKFGSKEHKEKWIAPILSGDIVPAFALTEPNVGSDIKSIETVAEKKEGSFVLNGKKKWITLGQIADLFLVFAKCGDKPTAFLVERNTPGVNVEPIKDVYGLRANMLAEIEFNNCEIPETNMVSKIGVGISNVAGFSLDIGRYTTAWGCVGLAQACLESSARYARKRKQFGQALRSHQLIGKMITEMIVETKAARLLCFNAGYSRETMSVDAVNDTLSAKYYASTAVTKIANMAVQIHGANGVGNEYPVQRYLRDSKIMELIEGATQLYELLISSNSIRNI